MALDIIFLSYDEPNADINFNLLQERFPYVKRVHGVKGIANAHKAAADLAETRLFYVVDGDTEVFQSFDFTFKPPSWDQDYVHIWKARNPVNGLEYGYGGVKLFSKKFFRNLEENVVDFSTSLTSDVKYLDEVASLTYFNSDEFRAWRGAFRECAKLSGKAIDGQINSETENRLRVWTTIADPNTYYFDKVLDGAKMGMEFGLQNQNDPEALQKVNDFNWLKDIFEQKYHGKD
jgi:hypothetical protein